MPDKNTKKSLTETVLGYIAKNIIRILLPLILGVGILWWMYRGTDWQEFIQCVLHDMKWGWMVLSLLFGLLPQLFRAWRWKMSLQPLGEQPSTRTCINAIFISYASSLVVPRIGEVTRCGTLKTYEGTSFTKSLGTVVTERIVDSLIMLLLTAVAFFAQLPVFIRFLRATDMNFSSVFGRFTGTGYIVTALCLTAAIGAILILVWRYSVFHKGKDLLKNVWEGIVSLRKVKNLPLYLIYSFGIWVAYFLHFYIAFFCFDFTTDILPVEAFLIFCIGSFAVLVPTPNGAGPWHFAVKTMLVIYGVAESQAILFALVVHTIQTALVVLLGLVGWTDLNRHSIKKAKEA